MPTIGPTKKIPFVIGGETPPIEPPPIEEPTGGSSEVLTGVGSRAVEEEASERPSAITIAENFKRRNYSNYDAFSTVERELLKGQRHVDIRTFTGDSGEKWSNKEEGTLSGFENYPGIKVEVTNGVETKITSFVGSIDLLTEFASTDFITLSLPSFPLSHVNLTKSYIELTSGPSLTEGPKAKVLLSESTSTIEAGDTEFRVARSAFEKNGIDLSKITGVTIGTWGTATDSVYYSGLRLVASTWKLSSIDYDNWNGRWRTPVPPDGSSAGAVMIPIIWRSDTPAGINDPRPIDSKIGVVFNTGSQEASNNFTLYARGTSEALITQNDLELPPYETQSKLDGRPQPDYGISEFETREIGSLDGLEMEELDLDTMRALQEIEDPVFDSYISLSLTWGQTNQVVLGNSAGNNYVVPFSELSPNAYYFAIFSLENSRARIQIYRLQSDFSVRHAPVFDSTEIYDNNTFTRHAGRLGWSAALGDNNAFIETINPRHLNFAEYISAPLTSLTPVSGAQLYATYSPNTQLWVDYSPSPSDTASTSSLERDTSRSTSGESYRLTIYEGINRGVVSNWFTITEFGQSGISFDLWYPSGLPGLKAKLVSPRGTESQLTLPFLLRDQWQHVTIPLENDLVQTGEYTLVIEQPTAGAGVWWIDSTEIFQRSVQWSARSVADDPWESNEAPWTDFREIINTDTSGILFPIRGNQLQLRARSLKQDAIISGSPKLKPRYAELGRLVWPENGRIFDPEANFTYSTISEPYQPNFIPFGEPIYTNEGNSLAIDSTHFYWYNEEPETIQRAPIGGGAVEDVLFTNEGHSETWSIKSLISDGTNLYWIAGGTVAKGIWKGPIAGGAATKIAPIVTTTEHGASYVELSVDSTYLYWIRKLKSITTGKTTESIVRAPKAEVPLIPSFNYIATGTLPGQSLFGVTENSTYMYMAQGAAIYRAKLSETEPKPVLIHTAPGPVQSLALNSSLVIFSWEGSGDIYRVGNCSLTGSSALDEWFSTNEEPPVGVSVDSNYAYWKGEEGIGRNILPGGTIVYEWSFTSTSIEGSAPLVSYFWEFGDGNTGTGISVTHNYASKGTYTVKLKVTDTNGLISVKPIPLTF